MKDEKNKALCASLYHFSFILYHLAKLCIAQIYHLSFVIYHLAKLCFAPNTLPQSLLHE